MTINKKQDIQLTIKTWDVMRLKRGPLTDNKTEVRHRHRHQP